MNGRKQKLLPYFLSKIITSSCPAKIFRRFSVISIILSNDYSSGDSVAFLHLFLVLSMFELMDS